MECECYEDYFVKRLFSDKITIAYCIIINTKGTEDLHSFNFICPSMTGL